jgi:hypothetical protein
MKLELIRTYFEHGTNGLILHNGATICATIELPWKYNLLRLSCIPEGEYELVKRYSQKFKEHLLLLNTAPRELILIHPANDALKELKGCIAPVSVITGQGKGTGSRAALQELMQVVGSAAKKEAVILSISHIAGLLRQ